MRYYRINRVTLFFCIIALFFLCNNRLHANVVDSNIDMEEVTLSNEFSFNIEGQWDFFSLKLLNENTKSNDFFIQYSDFYHVNKKMNSQILFISQKVLHNSIIFPFVFELIFFGGLLVVALYHFGLVIIRKYDLSAFYFAVFSAIISLRILFKGQEVIMNIFPGVDREILLIGDYLTLFLSPVFLILFINELYQKEVPVKLFKFFIILGVLLTVSVAIYHIEFYLYVAYAYRILLLLLFIYIFYTLIKSPKREIKEIVVLLGSGLIIFLVMFNDIFFRYDIINGWGLLPLGLFLFVLIQSFLISIRNARIQGENFDLAVKLDYNKANLEKIVKQRTDQLISRNKEIGEQWEKLKAINAKLEKQKKDLQEQRAEMKRINGLLEVEKIKSERLLFNILPREIAEELKTEGVATTKKFSNVSVLFTDFQDFFTISQGLNPEELVEELHYCFSNFDDILEKYQVDKIKTIGDAYMCAGGLTNKRGNWDVATVLTALEIRNFMEAYKLSREKTDKPYFKARIGVHSGPVISGVVGKSKFAFDIWGHTVNIASYIESECEVGMVNISYNVYNQVKHYFECESRGKISVGHKTDIEMFYVKMIKPDYSADAHGLIPSDLMLKECGLL